MSSSRDGDSPAIPVPEALQGAATDESTRLSRERTSLSVERSFLAFERTLMAWLRTSLSMIGFGFTLVKFFEYLEGQRRAPIVGVFGRTWATTTLGMAMIFIGTGALVVRKRWDTTGAQYIPGGFSVCRGMRRPLERDLHQP